MQPKNLLLFFLWFTFTCTSAWASHVMGGDLVYQSLGGNQYRVRLSLYRDCAGILPSSTVNINVGSVSCSQNFTLTASLDPTSPTEVSAVCASQLTNTSCNGGSLQGVQEYVYVGIVTLPVACTDWIFSWTECCRNSSISTINNPSSESLYLEAKLNSVAAPGNTSPDFTTKPVPYFGINQAQTYSHATIEPDGDILVYSLINPKTSSTTNVSYLSPYTATYPVATSSGSLTFNTTTGQMNFTPTTVQNGLLAVLVQEYRNGVLIGSVMRDIQMVILSTANGSTSANNPSSIAGASLVSGQTTVFNACVGVPMTFQITASDVNAGTIISHTSNHATNLPGSTISSMGVNPKVLTFSWTPPASAIGTNSFSINITDNACPMPSIINRNIVIYVTGVDIVNTDNKLCAPNTPYQMNTLYFGSGTGTYSWTGQGLSATNVANPTVTPTSLPSVYTVTYSLGGCQATDQITLVQSSASVRAWSIDSVLCSPKNIQLNATLGVNTSAGGTYSWSGAGISGGNTATPTAAISTLPQTYTLTYTTPSGGCVTTDNVTIVQSNILASTTSAAPSILCLGNGPIQLSSTPISSFAGYVANSIPYAPVSGTGTNITLSDDQLSAALPIGFNFSFYGNTYSNFYISSNGFISFDSNAGNGCCSGQVIPNSTSPNNVIALNWDDMYPPAGGTISYFTTGAAPNRKLVVSYDAINACCSANTATDMTGQIILFEGTNFIEIHATDIGVSSMQSMGIENASGTQGLAVNGRAGTDWSATNEGWRLIPDYTYSWYPTTNLSNPHIYNPIISTLVDTVYTVTIQSSDGCVGTSTVTIHTNTPLNALASASASPSTLCTSSTSPVQLNATPSSSGVSTGNAPYTLSSIPHAPVAGTGTTVALGDDQLSAALPIGFNFIFYGNTYTNFYISSNGFITFDATAGTGCCSGQAIPTATTPNNVIALNWDDMYPPAGGTISYFTTGTAPNRKLVVNYYMINRCCAANTTTDMTGQIVLYESDYTIEIFATDIGPSVGQTMGIESAGGTSGMTVSGRGNTTWSAVNEGWRFTSATSATHSYLWTPSTGISNTTIYNPTASGITATTTYNVKITDLANNCYVNKPVTITVATPITPNVSAVSYCNSAQLTVNNAYSGAINWYTNNTGSGSPVGTGSPFSATTSGTYYAFNTVGTCQGAVSNANTISVGMSTLWNQIPNPTPPISSVQSYYADAVCFDPPSGLNYFYQSGPKRLILASDYMLPAGVNLVSAPPLNATQMAVKVDVLPGYGSGMGTFINAPTAPYVTNPNGWYVMHRTWNVLVHPSNQIASGNRLIRFYFNAIDENDVSTPTGHTVPTFQFYKLITGLDPSNPANHAGVTTPQFNLYIPGASASTSTWALGWNGALGAYYSDYAVTSFSGGGGGSGIILPGPLPVNLLGFSGRNQADENLLFWKVSQEIQTERYEIERGNDGSTFSKIGEVKAQQLSDYSFTDKYPAIGENYYRLRIVDTDGQESYSNTIMLAYFPNAFHYELYPNPGNEQINIALEGLQGGEIFFKLYDELGKEVYTSVWNENGSVIKTIDIQHLASGVYFYRLFNDKANYRGKWVKE